MDALEHVAAVLDASKAGQPVPEEAVAWLVDGLTEHLEEGTPLEQALGLGGGQGQDKARTRFRLLRRAFHLRQAWELCDGEGPTDKSRELDRQVRRYEANIWPRQQHLAAPPAGSSQLRAQLFHAFKAAPVKDDGQPRIPAFRQLHEICAA
ncbi:MAG TPA: hypothetical protein VKA64_11085, partial [Gammaproteobacteria bacterium]|nr:hypothetical protein [Gammaproteobacteria bacterium]